MHKINDKDKLIQQINLAFSKADYPGDENLVDQTYGDEPALIRAHFMGQSDRTKLTPEFIDYDGALSFLSDKAFRFFLPAFMIADINDELNFNEPIVRLCWPVTPQAENQKIAQAWGGETVGIRARKCFDEFTKEQVSAIVAYLNFKLEHDKYNMTITQALGNYWLAREKNIS